MAMYDVVVADARAPRDGKFIEKIGRYNPNTDPAFIELDEAKAFEALAEPSVLTRLLTAEQHNLVPRNPSIPAGQDFEATEYYLVDRHQTAM